MLPHRLTGSFTVLFAAILFAATPGSLAQSQPNLAQSQSEIPPTGMSITPLAAPGTIFQSLDPGLPTLPDFRVDMAVTAARSPDASDLRLLYQLWL